MTDYAVKLFDNAGHSPAWPLVPHAMLDLEAQGFGFQPHVAPVWNDGCLAAINDDGEAMGFLIYRYDSFKCSWFIMLAWVAPAHRRKGIHTAMFTALVERAKKRGDILAIECGTHIDNVAAQAAFEAQGRTKTAIMYAYHLRDWLDGKDPADTEQR